MPYYLLVIMCVLGFGCPRSVICANSEDQKNYENDFLEHHNRRMYASGIIPLAFSQNYIDNMLDHCRQKNHKFKVKRIWSKWVRKFESKVDDHIMLHFRWVCPIPQPRRVTGIRCSENKAFVSKDEWSGYVVRKVKKRICGRMSAHDPFYIDEKIRVFQALQPEAPVRFDATPVHSEPSSPSGSARGQKSDENLRSHARASGGNQEITLVVDADHPSSRGSKLRNERQSSEEKMAGKVVIDNKDPKDPARDHISVASSSKLDQPLAELSTDKAVIASTLSPTHDNDTVGLLTSLHQHPTYDDELPEADTSLVGIFDGNLSGKSDRPPIYDDDDDDDPADGNLTDIWDTSPRKVSGHDRAKDENSTEEMLGGHLRYTKVPKMHQDRS